MPILDRRQFLSTGAAGAAVLACPPWLASCAGSLAVVPATDAPSTPGASFERFGVPRELLGKVLGRGLSRGGDFAEVFLQHKVTHTLGLEDGAVDRAFTEVSLGAGLRVLKGDATGYAFTEDLSEAALLQAAGTAAAVADGGPAEASAPLEVRAIANAYPVPVAWSDLGLETRLPLLERADQAARARDASVAKVSAWFEDETSRILIANSEGLLVEDDQPMAVLAVSVVAQKNGRTETGGWSRSVRDSLGAFTPAFVEGVATRAVDTTVVLFEAGPAPVGELPVVLGPGTPGILLHEAMGHGMEADFNRKGASIFSDRIGQRVAPAGVTIVDDGTNVRLRGSIAIDDEGTPTERTVLVDDGILRSYLHDRLSAAHYRLPSTGNGRRQSFRFPPLPRMRNTYLLNGTRDPNEIIASVERGLYAEDFSNGQVHIGGGDFTFFLKRGRMIEKGRLTHVVKDVNLIGNGPKVLTTLDLVGNDLELVSSGGYCGKDGQRVPVGFGLPTVRAGNISIGGRSA